MAPVIDANMKLFAERLDITSSRMIRDYGLANIEKIIEEETKKGNSKAINFAREYYSSPEKLINVFRLASVENKFTLIHHMDEETRQKILPLLKDDELVMGLYFFKQEALLKMLMKVNIKELARVAMAAFPLEQIVLMYTEDDMANFFMNDDLNRFKVMEQLQAMPADVLQKFIENVTGQPSEDVDHSEVFSNISNLPDDKFREFMAGIDPDVQRQLIFQLTKEEPKNLTLFQNETYVNMLATLQKPDMIKPMIMLNTDTLIKMVSKLPPDLLAAVGAQIDTHKFAEFLQDGHMDVIEDNWMI
ncbi:MAG: hypothetical protein MJ237_03380 [bacterium]|nr:hypothetical protein [bacterium]